MEEWCIIHDYPEYEASSLGRVRRITSKMGAKAGRILKPRAGNSGYLRVSLHKGDGNSSECGIASLVLTSFLGPRPANCEPNHKDGIKTNNFVDNLEWVTHSENMVHAYAIGLKPIGEKHPGAVISEAQAWLVKKLLHYGVRLVRVSLKTGVSFQIVRNIKHGGSWNHLKRTPV